LWCVQDSESALGRGFSEHVIVVLCAGSYSHEIGLVNLVRPLRASSLLTHRLRDIVFYAEPALLRNEWSAIANFPRIFVYPVRALTLLALSLCRQRSLVAANGFFLETTGLPRLPVVFDAYYSEKRRSF